MNEMWRHIRTGEDEEEKVEDEVAGQVG